MSFRRIQNPSDRKKVIDAFFKNRSILKQRVLEQKIGKQKLVEDIEEYQRPVVEKLQEAKKAIDDKQNDVIAELGRNQRAIAAAIPQHAIPQHAIPAPKSHAHTYAPPDIDMFILHQVDSDIPPLRDLLEFDNDQLTDLNVRIKNWKKEATRKNSRIQKMGKDFVASFKAELDKYRNEVEIARRALPGLQKKGTGVKYYKTPAELVKRLALLRSTMDDGNNSKRVSNELVEILTTLLNDKIISKREYKQIFSCYIKDGNA